jgi:transcriptional regulator with XRE-family HTH domain
LSNDVKMFSKGGKEMSTLGDRLRIARERKGYSQTEVYRRTNINNKTLSRYEKNGSEPDRETMIVLSNLYEVDYEWLSTGARNQNGKIIDEEFDPEVRSLARDIKQLEQGDKELLKGLIKSMSEKGKKMIDE